MTRARVAVDELRAMLLDVHREDTPFIVRDGADENADLVAELRFGDPHWRTLFSTAHVNRTYIIRMRFDTKRGVVRKKERSYEIRWRKGRVVRRRFSDVGFGEQHGVYNYVGYRRMRGVRLEKAASFTFRPSQLREPVVRTILGAGWECRNVTVRRL